MEAFEAYRRFEDLVARIFEAADFQAIRSGRLSRKGPDLVVIRAQIRAVVEIKVYRSRTPNPSDIRRAIETIDEARHTQDATAAILIVNIRSDRLRSLLPDLENVVLLGIEHLVALADGNEELLAEIADVIRELNSALADFDRPVDTTHTSRAEVMAMILRRPSGPSVVRRSVKPKRGAILAQDLRAILPGGSKAKQTLPSGEVGVPWRLFERVGRSALEYVFEGVFGDWAEQRPVGGEANRLDIMAKVRGDDVFCRTLIEDFRSRHVLFELKNYGNRIKANNIHITEKYLFPTALRSTAIVISPKGLDDHAVAATKGALRDANKLFLDMKVDMLCTMLAEKDAGTPPSLRMEALLDEFLLSLGR